MKISQAYRKVKFQGNKIVEEKETTTRKLKSGIIWQVLKDMGIYLLIVISMVLKNLC